MHPPEPERPVSLAIKGDLPDRRRGLPAEWDRLLKACRSPQHARRLRDLAGVAWRHGLGPDQVDEATLCLLEATLETGSPNALMARRNAWRGALDLLAADGVEGVPVGPFARPRGQCRKHLPPAMLPPALVAGLARWASQAGRPWSGYCDPHRPLAPKSISNYVQQAQVVASRLVRSGVLGQDASLEDLLDLSSVGAWLGEEVAKASTPDGSARGSVTTYLAALRRIAQDVLGPGHEVTVALADQVRHWLPGPGMGDRQLAGIQAMLAPATLRALFAAPGVMMARAEDGQVQPRSRLVMANHAVGLQLQLDLGLAPGVLASLRLVLAGEDGVPGGGGTHLLLPSQIVEADLAVPLSDEARQLLARRGEVRARLGAPASDFLFPSRDPRTHQGVNGVQGALAVALAKLGVPGVTLMLLRDLGVALLAADDRDNLCRIADFLDFKDIITARRRFGPLLNNVRPKNA